MYVWFCNRIEIVEIALRNVPSLGKHIIYNGQYYQLPIWKYTRTFIICTYGLKMHQWIQP